MADATTNIESVIDDTIRRRSAGERLSDAQVISRHPELMPELDEWLGKLRLLSRARQRADSATRLDADFEESFAPRIVVDGYEILREINRGGQAIVFLARAIESSALVAIKTLLDGTLAHETAQVRFEREARILASLNAPGIVKVLHKGTTRSGMQYLIMPYIDGESLESRFAKKYIDQDIRPQQLRLFVKILRAVGAAHAHGVIHRDLKPSNIRIDANGDPHVLDFGLAQRIAAQAQTISQTITVSGQFVGSYPWASPEQAGSGDDVTVRSDVYSLGILLYQLITGGRFPYHVNGPLREVLNNIIATKPVAPSELRLNADPRLDAILMKALSKSPKDRYADANDFADDVQRVLDGKQIAGAQRSLRRRQILAAMLLIMISILAAVAIRWTRPARNGAQPMVNGRPRIELVHNCTLIWIPAGEFVMGSPLAEIGRLADEAQHNVTIARGFYMLLSEVSQDVYQKVMGTNPSRFPGYLNPVEQVSWNDAQEFCRRLSKMTGRHVRLPSEAEWEYACRAGSKTDWNFGDNQDLAPRYANFYDASSPQTRPGRSVLNDGYPYTAPGSRFIANNFGLVDMHGNVWEWCQDEYMPYDGTPSASHTGQRVSRGGSWYDSIPSLRSAHRNPLNPSFKNDNVGFRIVMDDPAAPTSQ